MWIFYKLIKNKKEENIIKITKRQKDKFLRFSNFSKLILSIGILFICFFMLFIDLKTYTKAENNWTLFHKLTYILSWWSFWTLLFISLISILLIYLEIYIYIKKSTTKANWLLYVYNLLKIYGASYAFLTAFIYNFIRIFFSSLITDNPHSVQSMIEHVITPIFFLSYFILNINNKIYLKTDNKNIFLEMSEIILLGWIYPITYVIYAVSYGIITDNFPYFFLDFNKEGIFIFICYIALCLMLFSSIICIYSGAIIFTRINMKNNKYINKIKNYLKK